MAFCQQKKMADEKLRAVACNLARGSKLRWGPGPILANQQMRLTSQQRKTRLVTANWDANSQGYRVLTHGNMFVDVLWSYMSQRGPALLV